MEILQRPDLRADFSPRPEQVMAPEAVVTIPQVGRGRVGRLEVAREIDADVTRGAEIVTPRGAARQGAAGTEEHPLVDAREASRREGGAATRRELLMRASKRAGLPQAEAARSLGGAFRRDGMAASIGLGARRPRDPVSRLAATILGVREREVFLARRLARPDDVAALHELAACLGISAERVYELEASARRKLTRALG